MKRFLIILGIVIIVLGITLYSMITFTKSASQEGNVVFTNSDLKVTVSYNRPHKKGRSIFAVDGLVPFGKVWRTGANEATVFETTKDLNFDGQKLAKGRYSLWTIPNERSWKIIFNSDLPIWGMGFDGQVLRVPEKDALIIEVPVVIQDKEFEQFTISVEQMGEEMEMIFIWDKTVVAAPFTIN